MKLTHILATTAIVTLSATSAFSQSAIDGSFGFAYINAPDDSFDYQTQIDGSLVYSLSQSIKFQMDLGSTTYEGSDSDFNYGIHAIYSPSDAFDVGVFYSEEVDGYHYAGVEVAYDTGAFNIEAHAEIEDVFDNSSYYTLGAQVGYTFGGIGSLPGGVEVYAGVNSQYDDSGISYPRSVYVGLDVDVWNGLQLNTRAASMDDGDYRYYTVGLTYNYGNGAVFAARDFSSTFPGY